MINLEYYREKIKDFLDDNLSHRGRLNETFGYEVKYGENFVEKFITWALEEHPQKTYKDDFLEKFPNAQIDEFKVPRVHWCEVYNDGVCRYKSTGGMHLCCDCWDEPMED